MSRGRSAAERGGLSAAVAPAQVSMALDEQTTRPTMPEAHRARTVTRTAPPVRAGEASRLALGNAEGPVAPAPSTWTSGNVASRPVREIPGSRADEGHGTGARDSRRTTGGEHVRATRPTNCSRLRALLADGNWHTMGALRDAAGWRYGGRLHDLKTGRDGGPLLEHETHRDDDGLVWYRAKGDAR